MDDETERRERAMDEQLAQMADQARQEAERQAIDNAAAERLRTHGDPKRVSKADLRGEETIAGPTGPTSSVFGGQTLDEQEGDTGGGSAEDR